MIGHCVWPPNYYWKFNSFVCDTKTNALDVGPLSTLPAKRLPLPVEEDGGQNEDDQADTDDRSQLQLLLPLSSVHTGKNSVFFQSPSCGR